MTCPPSRLRGCAILLSGFPNTITHEPPNRALVITFLGPDVPAAAVLRDAENDPDAVDIVARPRQIVDAHGSSLAELWPGPRPSRCLRSGMVTRRQRANDQGTLKRQFPISANGPIGP
jgi:hypothetical protein